MNAEACLVQVFAKAPVPGRGKTRLIPRLGADGAAELHRRLTRHTLITAATASVGATELWCTAPIEEMRTDAGQGWPAADARLQPEAADLGARMAHALRDGLRRALPPQFSEWRGAGAPAGSPRPG